MYTNNKQLAPAVRIAGKRVEFKLESLPTLIASGFVAAALFSPSTKDNLGKIKVAAAVSNARIEQTTAKAIDRKDFEFDRAQQAVTAKERLDSGRCVFISTVPHNKVVLGPDGATPLGVGTCLYDPQGMTAVIVDDDGDWNTPGLTQKLAQSAVEKE